MPATRCRPMAGRAGRRCRPCGRSAPRCWCSRCRGAMPGRRAGALCRRPSRQSRPMARSGNRPTGAKLEGGLTYRSGSLAGASTRRSCGSIRAIRIASSPRPRPDRRAGWRAASRGSIPGPGPGRITMSGRRWSGPTIASPGSPSTGTGRPWCRRPPILYVQLAHPGMRNVLRSLDGGARWENMTRDSTNAVGQGSRSIPDRRIVLGRRGRHADAGAAPSKRGHGRGRALVAAQQYRADP